MTEEKKVKNIYGSPTECAYCGRKGQMIFVPDGHHPDKPWFVPLYACNLLDCTGYTFHDVPQGKLDA